MLVLGGFVCIFIIFAGKSAERAEAEAGKKCSGGTGPPPQRSVKRLRELQANPARPTFTIPMDAAAAATDDITLRVKGSRRVGKTKRAATAVLETPRQNNRRLPAIIDVGAEPTALGTGVVVFACISSKGPWSAGTYEGAIEVYGPRFRPFTVPLVVTTKWSPLVPLLIISTVLLVFFGLECARSGTGGRGNTIYAIIAVAAGSVSYFAQYDEVDTWGDKPGVQLTALVVAVVTGAAAGRAAARKMVDEETPPA